jgi:hypothetical protein
MMMITLAHPSCFLLLGKLSDYMMLFALSIILFALINNIKSQYYPGIPGWPPYISSPMGCSCPERNPQTANKRGLYGFESKPIIFNLILSTVEDN